MQLGYELLVASVNYTEKTGEALDAAYAKCAAIVDRIIDAPATTMGGLRVKVLALRWTHAFDLNLFDSLGETTDVHVLDSLVRDLIAV